MRLPLAQAVHAAVREVAHRHRDPDRVDEVAGVLKAFALRTELKDRKRRSGGSRRSTWSPPRGRADSGDLELDLIELFTDVASLAGDLGVGIALFVDEMQDIPTAELAALCGAGHEISQQGAPLIVVGAGPAAPAGRRSPRPSRTPSGCSATSSVDRLPREMAERAWTVPAASEDVDVRAGGARRALPPDRRLPLLRAGLRQGHLGRRRRDPDHAGPTCVQAAPEAEAELAVGLLRRPLRPGHPGRARLHGRDGRPRRGRRRPGGRHRRRRQARSAASRSRSPRPATA